MKLAQRMVNNFCASISSSNGHRWTTLSGLNEVGVRVTIHKNTDPGQPNGVVLSAATTIWLPVSPQNVFNFFRDERTRPQVGSTCLIGIIYILTSNWKLLCFGNLFVLNFGRSGMFSPMGMPCKRLHILLMVHILVTAYLS